MLAVLPKGDRAIWLSSEKCMVSTSKRSRGGEGVGEGAAGPVGVPRERRWPPGGAEGASSEAAGACA